MIRSAILATAVLLVNFTSLKEKTTVK